MVIQGNEQILEKITLSSFKCIRAMLISNVVVNLVLKGWTEHADHLFPLPQELPVTSQDGNRF